MLSIELYREFSGFTLDAQWDAASGVVALFGPTGAGKSLTLRCLAGLMSPQGGRIVVNGRTLYDSTHGVNHPTRDRRLGVVFQGYALFPHLSVEENIAYGLERLRRKARRARIEEMLERLALGPVRHLRPASLSGGQQQRVALGRALAADPELLLLDEPLAALDSPLRRSLRDDLAATIRGFGKSAILVTHDLAEACQLADQLVVYDQGRVLQAGPKDLVLTRPATPAVASVLGIRNVLEGTVIDSSGDTLRLKWRGQELVAEGAGRAMPLPPGSRVAFCIRPEHITLMRKDRHGPATARQINMLTGVIVDEVDLGAVSSLRFRVNGDGADASRGYDLEIEISKLIYQKLCVHYDRNWTVSVQPGAVQLLPHPDSSPTLNGDLASVAIAARSYRTSLKNLRGYITRSIGVYREL
ncbi:MAG TPA: ABC transporter ATP-binding protein [Gemmatimonadales bacterium]|nr:ABC transporter ATP-binding protein [Gemmatimonadales bacterium]